MTITVELTDTQSDLLQQTAQRKGVPVDVLVQAAIERSYRQASVDIDSVITQVVQEHRELYKRLG